MEHHFEIGYKNVLLRPLEKKDIEKLREWRNDPDNSKYLSRLPYITPEMQGKWYEKYIANSNELCFAIIENDELFQMVGSLSLYDLKKTECTFGKILIGEKKAHGRKLGENATIAATKIAFNCLGLTKVNLCVFTNNIVAIKVYQNAGFSIKNVHRTENGETEYTMTIQRGDD